MQLPPLHAVPSLAAGFEHVPSDPQLPATWHSSCAAHTTAVPPQTPAVHTSLVVHVLPSSHVGPVSGAIVPTFAVQTAE